MSIKKAIKSTTKTNPAIEKPTVGGYHDVEIPRKSGNYIVMAVQNNTHVHAHFWELLQAYASDTNSGIICCPMPYNKNAWAQPDDGEAKGMWFDEKVRPYLEENRFMVGDTLVVSNAHVLPTAKNPLSGFQSISGGALNVVIPASKIALECLPALKGEQGRLLLATGTATLCNYVQRKAGVTAETEHAFGFVYVPEHGLPRSVQYVNGGFFDFDGADITAYGIAGDPNPVLTFGDIHAEKCGSDRIEAMRSLAQKIDPVAIVVHDLLDFTSRNHHNRENPFFIVQQNSQGATVMGDLAKANSFLQAFNTWPIQIVESNHDLALDRWLNEADWRDDPANAATYLALALRKVNAMMRGQKFNAFESALKHGFGDCLDHVTFNFTDSSVTYHGCEHGNHGDKGPNGARGSLQAFRKIGQNMVIGHSHTPGIAGGVYQVGVGGDLDMGYNCGPSSWRNAHCITYSNGQRQLIIER